MTERNIDRTFDTAGDDGSVREIRPLPQDNYPNELAGELL